MNKLLNIENTLEFCMAFAPIAISLSIIISIYPSMCLFHNSIPSEIIDLLIMCVRDIFRESCSSFKVLDEEFCVNPIHERMCLRNFEFPAAYRNGFMAALHNKSHSVVEIIQ